MVLKRERGIIIKEEGRVFSLIDVPVLNDVES
jgi:hypothetical protein